MSNLPSTNEIRDNIGSTVEKTRDTVKQNTGSFGRETNNLPSKLRSGVDDASSKLRSGADDASSKLRSGVDDASSKLRSGANDVTSKLKIVAAKSNIKSPLPSELPSEVNKAADILRCFAGKNVIPRDVIRNARGLAIFTVVKAGIFWTGRAGSGIIIARTQKGNWSPPSCIGVVGIGFGLQSGIDVTNFVVVLNTDEAVKAFSTGDNVTLGGNLSISAGPIGMGTEFSSSIYERSALYSYSWSKGFFAGVSIEGTVIMQRKFANKQYYHNETSVAEILNGKGDTSDLSELYDVLNYLEGKESNDIISNKHEQY